jgi:2-polyprenyl-3-methyl-5-hydroxy-6-metoxy-1,4-benzoquinol methylase
VNENPERSATPCPAALRRLLQSVEFAWPQHKHFLERHAANITPVEIDYADHVAADILLLAADDLDHYAADYRWMCGQFLKNELDWRRSGRPAFSDPEEIRKNFYDNAACMERYMRGLLLSQVCWPQHLGPQLHFERSFLASLAPRYRYLEIGPGSGLTLARAARDPWCASATGYDLSPSSLHLTALALRRLGVTTRVELEAHNIQQAVLATTKFDAIYMSQVLELVPSPATTLGHLAALLAPGGKLCLNCPVGLPAPDHLRAWSSGSDIDELLVASGLRIADRALFHSAEPEGSGYSYVVVART